jgi:hypothetical protein
MNLKADVRIKKSALTPALSLQEREKEFPRSGKIQPLDLRWFRGSMRECFGEISPQFAPPTPQNAERENRFQRPDESCAHYLPAPNQG